MDSHVWVRSDDLLLWGQLGALLELKIPNGSRQGKIAIDTPKVNKTPSSRNSSLLT